MSQELLRVEDWGRVLRYCSQCSVPVEELRIKFLWEKGTIKEKLPFSQVQAITTLYNVELLMIGEIMDFIAPLTEIRTGLVFAKVAAVASANDRHVYCSLGPQGFKSRSQSDNRCWVL